MSKEEAVLTLMDSTLKYFATAGLVIVVGFGLLFLIGYTIDFVERNSNDREPLEKIEELKRKGKEKYESRLDKEVDEQKTMARGDRIRDGADDGQGCST